jgi:hypothetical protein
MVKMQAEVDEVLGDRQIQIEDVGKLKYVMGTIHSLVLDP